MTKKVMKLIDPYKGLLQCKVCGQLVFGMIKPDSGGHFYRGTWQCPNGCRLEEIEPVFDKEYFIRSEEAFRKIFETIKQSSNRM
jgi:hypothetical protein